MPKIEIVYFSGYGHTAKMAQAVHEGAAAAGDARLWAVSPEGQLDDAAWEALDSADAILFGSPTYMGGPAWQMKRFADDSSKRWFGRDWQDKLAGGFTNSASTNGDKYATLMYFTTLAAQHGMLWVSLGQAPANTAAHGPADANWAGGSHGPLGISPSDASAEDAPRKGDLDSARAYGTRVAELAAKFA
jgi:multimeric flavodoxin WrbA